MAEGKEIKDIQDLPGIGPLAADKLYKANYRSLESIAVASPMELTEIAGLGEKTAEKAIEAARGALDMGFETADKIQKRREKMVKLATGSKELDSLLGGGIETMSITEIYGKMASGKSQWCFQMCVNAQLPPEKGGLGGSVLYIDSESSFRPERVASIAKAKGMEPEKVLKNIYVARAYNADHQMLLAEKAEELVREKGIKILIVDSLTSQFRAEYIGRGTLAERQQKLNKHMRALMKLAEMLNIAVLVTNQVMARPDIMFGDPTEPVGGHVVGHACLAGDTLVQLSDGGIQEIQSLQDNQRVFNADWEKLHIKEDVIDVRTANPGIGTVYDIEVGHSITASPEHRFFSLDGFRLREMQAKEIRKGDYLALAGRIPATGSLQSLSVEQPMVLAIASGKGAQFIKNSLQDMGVSRKQACTVLSVTPRQLRRVLNQGARTNNETFEGLVRLGVASDVRKEIQPVTTHKHRNLVLPTVFSEELAQLTGYFLGDGTLEHGGIEFKDMRKEVLEEYAKIAERLFGVRTRITPVSKKNAYRLRAHGVEIRGFMEGLKQDYWKLVAKSPNSVVKGFLRGFVDAEGSVDKKVRRIGISQKNKKLLQFTQLLLLRFGIHSRLTEYTKPHCMLDLFSEDVVKFHELVGLTAPDKKELLENWAESFRENRSKQIVPVQREKMVGFLREVFGYPTRVLKPRPYKHITRRELEAVVLSLQGKELGPENQPKKEFLERLLEGEVRLEKVRHVAARENREPLYDLSVQDTENYVANGFLVHNSKTRLYLRKSKGETRIARLVDSPHLPDGEAIYKVTEKGIEDAEAKEKEKD